jgi:LmbE family N-acetylglucosaminyl deacetylase
MMRSVDPMRTVWPVDSFNGCLPQRVMAVSPHFDDAIMSVGALLAQSVRAGVKVEVLTVFGGDPTSESPADPWDFASGFRTEGQAAVARREEDRLACASLQVTPVWLTFGAEAYDRRGSQEDIWTAVFRAALGADCVLLPGYPLVHRDHAELTVLLLRRGLSCLRTGLYIEQPYSFYQRHIGMPPEWVPALRSVLTAPPVWSRFPLNRAYRRAKMQAITSYRSQLRQLGLGPYGRRRMLWHEASQGGEAVSWLPAPAARAPHPRSFSSRLTVSAAPGCCESEYRASSHRSDESTSKYVASVAQACGPTGIEGDDRR